MEETKEIKLTTWQILRYKFPENEYVLIQEVSDASGFSRSRSLDLLERNSASYLSLKKSVEEFEKHAGIDISYRWNGPEKVGKAIKLLMSGKQNKQA